MPGDLGEGKGGARFRGVLDAADEVAEEGSPSARDIARFRLGGEEGSISLRAPEETFAPVLLTNWIICSILPPKRHPWVGGRARAAQQSPRGGAPSSTAPAPSRRQNTGPGRTRRSPRAPPGRAVAAPSLPAPVPPPPPPRPDQPRLLRPRQAPIRATEDRGSSARGPRTPPVSVRPTRRVRLPVRESPLRLRRQHPITEDP